MIVSGIILAVTLLVFALGKSPVFRVDRAGVAIIGGALTIAAGLTVALSNMFSNVPAVMLLKSYILVGFPLTIVLTVLGIAYFAVVQNFY